MLSLRGILFLILTTASLFSEISEPYRSIKELPFDPQMVFNNAPQIDELMRRNPKIIVEVGSWLGVSTRHMASRVKKEGRVYAIGMWMGSKDGFPSQTDPRLPSLYQLFLSTVKRAGLTEVIVPIRMQSLEAAKALDVKADLIYIDNGRDSQSVYDDIMAWHPHLNEGGVICGDDWGWPTVRSAVMSAAQMLNVSVVSQGNFWMYH